MVLVDYSAVEGAGIELIELICLMIYSAVEGAGIEPIELICLMITVL